MKDSPIMTRASAIERLPNELLDDILSLVEGTDLLSLRATCQSLNAYTIDDVSQHSESAE